MVAALVALKLVGFYKGYFDKIINMT